MMKTRQQLVTDEQRKSLVYVEMLRWCVRLLLQKGAIRRLSRLSPLALDGFAKSGIILDRRCRALPYCG